MGLFLPLDVTWPDDESIIEVGLEGAGAHAFIMCIAKRSETDGWVGSRVLRRYGITEPLLDLLATCDPEPLIERREDGAVRSVGWLKRNLSQAALAARKQSKVRAGIKGNHERWHSGDFEACTPCQAKVAEVIAGSDPTPIAAPIPPVSPESESEGEGASDRTGSHPGFGGPKPVDQIAAARAATGRAS